MQLADVLQSVVRSIACIVILVMLAKGAFKTDAGAALAAIVALTTAVGAAHNVVHAKSCDGHNGK